MMTLAFLGMWGLTIILILAFFAGAQRVSRTNTAASTSHPSDEAQKAPIAPPMREMT